MPRRLALVVAYLVHSFGTMKTGKRTVRIDGRKINKETERFSHRSK